MTSRSSLDTGATLISPPESSLRARARAIAASVVFVTDSGRPARSWAVLAVTVAQSGSSISSKRLTGFPLLRPAAHELNGPAGQPNWPG